VGASVNNAASLYVTSPALGAATNQCAIYVEANAKSRFGVDVLLNSDPSLPKNFNAFYGGFIGRRLTIGNP
jgi:hypothetical protein